MQQLFFQQIFLFFFKKHYKLIIDFLKIIVLKFLSKLEKGDVKKLDWVFSHPQKMFENYPWYIRSSCTASFRSFSSSTVNGSRSYSSSSFSIYSIPGTQEMSIDSIFCRSKNEPLWYTTLNPFLPFVYVQVIPVPSSSALENTISFHKKICRWDILTISQPVCNVRKLFDTIPY